jgi:hypothetical protein
MRSINFESNPDDYGTDELEHLLSHCGEEKVWTLFAFISVLQINSWQLILY